jgi:DNA ligase-1
MKKFAELFTRLDQSNKTTAKLEALSAYFSEAPPEDAAWAVAFLLGKKPKTSVNATQLRRWAAETAGIPDWLLDECYQSVGDLAETLALLLPLAGQGSDHPLHWWVEERLLPLKKLSEEDRKISLVQSWRELDQAGRFVFTKLLTGGWRLGVSQRLVTRALAASSGADPNDVAHRLMGDFEPTADFFRSLTGPQTPETNLSRPYPFFLSYPLDQEVKDLGPVTEWCVEWKWDGVRAQIVNREGHVAVWSRGEELVTSRFPEITAAAQLLPNGTVLDGELLAWKGEEVLPFSSLQRRLGRKEVGKKLLAEVPVVFLAFDLLEWEGTDCRSRPLAWRREHLEHLMGILPGNGALRLSTCIHLPDWESYARLRGDSRDNSVEGFMLKRLDSIYDVGRKRGPWWKWKVDPYTVDAVLIYAERGHGRRASLYTDYTFGVWDGDTLVPFAKAYSGLTDAEIRRVDAFIRRHTLERFGPVRRVKPELVMEIAFEGIQTSSRHRSGVAVRFPRIAHWRTDKPPEEAESLETVKALLLQGKGPELP